MGAMDAGFEQCAAQEDVMANAASLGGEILTDRRWGN
jgi:hypothetical protein